MFKTILGFLLLVSSQLNAKLPSPILGLQGDLVCKKSVSSKKQVRFKFDIISENKSEITVFDQKDTNWSYKGKVWVENSQLNFAPNIQPYSILTAYDSSGGNPIMTISLAASYKKASILDFPKIQFFKNSPVLEQLNQPNLTFVSCQGNFKIALKNPQQSCMLKGIRPPGASKRKIVCQIGKLKGLKLDTGFFEGKFDEKQKVKLEYMANTHELCQKHCQIR